MLVRKIFLALFFIALTTSLSACGRKNAPIAPDDVEETYPRTYPAPTPAPIKK